MVLSKWPDFNTLLQICKTTNSTADSKYTFNFAVWHFCAIYARRSSRELAFTHRPQFSFYI